MVFKISILIFFDVLLLCVAPPDKSVFQTACVHTVAIGKFTEHSCDFSTGLNTVIKIFTSASFQSTVWDCGNNIKPIKSKKDLPFSICP